MVLASVPSRVAQPIPGGAQSPIYQTLLESAWFGWPRPWLYIGVWGTFLPVHLPVSDAAPGEGRKTHQTSHAPTRRPAALAWTLNL